MMLRRRRGALAEVLPWVAVVAAAGGAVFVAVHGVGGGKARSAPVTHSVAAAPQSPRRPPKRAAPPPTATPARNVAIKATRGDCWLEARVASPTGAVLFRGLLRRGRAARFKTPAVWISFGASQNVDVRVNGRPRRIPQGTVSLVLRTRTG
jgi:hypothetical protein